MACIHRLTWRVGNSSTDPHHGDLLDSKLHGDRVYSFETDPADITRQLDKGSRS
jgi:hypothetical protein